MRLYESPHARAFDNLGKPVLIDAISRFLAACSLDAGSAAETLDGELARRCWPKEPFIPRMTA